MNAKQEEYEAMPSILYTKKQAATITRAFSLIERAVEETDWSLPARWRDAFKYERKGRNSAHAAKALMVDAARKGSLAQAGVEPPRMPADLSQWSGGLVHAYCIGGELWRRGLWTVGIANAALDAAKAHVEGRDAAFERIDAEREAARTSNANPEV